MPRRADIVDVSGANAGHLLLAFDLFEDGVSLKAETEESTMSDSRISIEYCAQ